MTRATLAAALVVMVAACNGGPKSTAPRPPVPVDAQESAAVNKTTPNAGRFERGPQVTPVEQLIAWLDAQQRDGKPRLVRLPVVLARRGPGFSTVGARIGGASDALTVFVDDAKLGIGLADRARTACKDTPTCALWLEGYWRGQLDGDYTFEVTAVRDPIALDALVAAGFAEVEGEGGN